MNATTKCAKAHGGHRKALTEEQVFEILCSINTGTKAEAREVAKRLEVSPGTVRRLWGAGSDEVSSKLAEDVWKRRKHEIKAEWRHRKSVEYDLTETDGHLTTFEIRVDGKPVLTLTDEDDDRTEVLELGNGQRIRVTIGCTYCDDAWPVLEMCE